MNTKVCLIGFVLAIALAAPVAAQDAIDSDTVWAPWATTHSEAPVVRARTAPATVTRVVAEAAPQAPEPRHLHIDRIWVVGSFR